MRYLASVNDLASAPSHPSRQIKMSYIEEQILATNPVLESFGNAKTTRNDNSSRFGKYIEIKFDEKARIKGAFFRTYLLERSRLVYQPANERNYHIFYQLCKAAPPELKEQLKIENVDDFYYLKQGGANEIEGVDDIHEFSETKNALSLIGVSEHLQTDIFKLLAGLLHLGNVVVGGSENYGAKIETGSSFDNAVELLQLSPELFKKWLEKRQIVVRNEKVIKTLTPSQGVVVRDSVAKYIYANLFDWLVKTINEKVCSSVAEAKNFIGVLDIYGFEHFEANSFEQFCINYANEKLQQHFNQHVFKLEQEEYKKEQISNWTFISFSDNQPCIDLIEGKIGVLSLLDEECRFPKADDNTFVQKLYTHFETKDKETAFRKPRFSNTAFTIVHYANDVTYEAEGFLEKNKDTVPDEMLEVLNNTKFEFLQQLFPPLMLDSVQEETSPARGRKGSGAAHKKKTLGAVFKLSLVSLMDTISATESHYIRCIKPNEAKKAWVFDPQMILSQLRACGVLETIRISCSGFPSRRSILEFVDRFYLLVESKLRSKDERQFASVIANTVLQDEDKYQIGLSKIFFRAGQLAHLEKLRAERINEAAIMIQKYVKRIVCQKRYIRLKKCTIAMQALVRRNQAIRLRRYLMQLRAACKIQTWYRSCTAQRWYSRTRRSIIICQSAVRRRIAVIYYNQLKAERAAIKIQATYRRWVSQKEYHRVRSCIVLAQGCWRMKLAKAELKKLRLEARSLKTAQAQKLKLENTVADLTQKVNQQQQDNRSLNKRLASALSEIDQLKAEIKRMEEARDNLANSDGSLAERIRAEKDNEMNLLAEELEKVRSEANQSDKAIEGLTNALSLKTTEVERLNIALEESRQKLEQLIVEKEKPNRRSVQSVEASAIAEPPIYHSEVIIRKNSDMDISESMSSILAPSAAPNHAISESIDVQLLQEEIARLRCQLESASLISKSELVNANGSNNEASKFMFAENDFVNGISRDIDQYASVMAEMQSEIDRLNGELSIWNQIKHLDLEKEISNLLNTDHPDSAELLAKVSGNLQDSNFAEAQHEIQCLRQEIKRLQIQLADSLSERASYNGLANDARSRHAKAPVVVEDKQNEFGQPSLAIENHDLSNSVDFSDIGGLLESDELFNELVDDLVSSVYPPVPDMNNFSKPPAHEVLYPAHLIGLSVLRMVQATASGARVRQLMMGVISAVQKETLVISLYSLHLLWKMLVE